MSQQINSRFRSLTIGATAANAYDFPLEKGTEGQILKLSGSSFIFSDPQDIDALVNAENGLTEAGGTVSLGGTLTQNTTIDGDGKQFIVDNALVGIGSGINQANKAYLYSFGPDIDLRSKNNWGNNSVKASTNNIDMRATSNLEATNVEAIINLGTADVPGINPDPFGVLLRNGGTAADDGIYLVDANGFTGTASTILAIDAYGKIVDGGALIDATVNAENGLTETGGTVSLGGTLIQDTTILGGVGTDFSITGVSDYNIYGVTATQRAFYNHQIQAYGDDNFIGRQVLELNHGDNINDCYTSLRFNQAPLGATAVTIVAVSSEGTGYKLISGNDLVADLVPAITANNGITNNAGTIQLGGSLIQNTTINTVENNLTVTSDTNATFISAGQEKPGSAIYVGGELFEETTVVSTTAPTRAYMKATEKAYISSASATHTNIIDMDTFTPFVMSRTEPAGTVYQRFDLGTHYISVDNGSTLIHNDDSIGRYERAGNVSSTGTTPADLITDIRLNNEGSSGLIEAEILGRDATNNLYYSAKLRAAYKKEGGVISQINVDSKDEFSEFTTVSVDTAVVDANNIKIVVTGEAGKTIDWRCIASITKNETLS
jgi:hypothetical protein